MSGGLGPEGVLRLDGVIDNLLLFVQGFNLVPDSWILIRCTSANLCLNSNLYNLPPTDLIGLEKQNNPLTL